MLSIKTPSIYQSPKCFVTYAKSVHPNPEKPPTKGHPWSAILAQEFIHKVDLLLPNECYHVVRQKLVEERPSSRFSRVIMRLSQILDGAFFSDYIKRGSVLMLSEGHKTVDNVFALRNGKLTMYLDRETYERAGLVGHPYGAKGNRGLRPRWVVHLDLGLPSMLHGKKGFDRLLYACKNVLNQPMTWLFCNVGESAGDPDPLDAHHPVTMTCDAQVSNANLRVPTLDVPQEVIATWDRTLFEEFATDVYEWLSLVRLQSPRVEVADRIDPYLSSYEVWDDHARAETVCKISWTGLLDPVWVRGLLMDAMRIVPAKLWFSLSSTCMTRDAVGNCPEITVLRPASRQGEYVMWQMQSHE